MVTPMRLGLRQHLCEWIATAEANQLRLRIAH
jgi:hypothetical protein